MPMFSVTSFDNTGKPYNLTQILTPQVTLDVAQYEAYSPLFLSTSFAMLYGLNFAAIASTLTHVMLFYRDQLWEQARRSLRAYGNSDIHGRLMSVYDHVPDWWYVLMFSTCTTFLSINSDSFNKPYVTTLQLSPLSLGWSVSNYGTVKCLSGVSCSLLSVYSHSRPLSFKCRSDHHFQHRPSELFLQSPWALSRPSPTSQSV